MLLSCCWGCFHLCSSSGRPHKVGVETKGLIPLGIGSRTMKTYVYTITSTQMSTAALFLIDRICKPDENSSPISGQMWNRGTSIPQNTTPQ